MKGVVYVDISPPAITGMCGFFSEPSRSATSTPVDLRNSSCFAGPDFDVLNVLSAGGLKIAFLTLCDSLQCVAVDETLEIGDLAAPAALALRKTAAVTLR